MTVDQKVVVRLDELLKLGEQVLCTQHPPPEWIRDDHYVDGGLAQQWVTSAMSLLGRVFGTESDHYIVFCKITRKRLTYSPVFQALGILRAAKDDYEHGYLFKMRNLIEAELLGELLGQAESLHSQGYFRAAVVVAGCALEIGLKKVCVEHGVKLPIQPQLDLMNAELAKAGLSWLSG